MIIDLPVEVWPHIWVKSANRFGELVDICWQDGRMVALCELDMDEIHQVKPPRGYSYAVEVELDDVYRFHTTAQ